MSSHKYNKLVSVYRNNKLTLENGLDIFERINYSKSLVSIDHLFRYTDSYRQPRGLDSSSLRSASLDAR